MYGAEPRFDEPRYNEHKPKAETITLSRYNEQMSSHDWTVEGKTLAMQNSVMQLHTDKNCECYLTQLHLPDLRQINH